MPTVFILGYKFRFYSSDGNEPPHCHLIREQKVAKIWLDSLEPEYNHGYGSTELNRILRLTRQNQNFLLEVWYEYFTR